jgi:ABC-type multidrug transport system ATPase subunit
MLHQGHITAQGTEAELAERFGYGVTNIELVVRGGAEALREAIERIEGAQVLGIVPAHATYRDAPEGALRAEVRATRDVREEVAKAVVSAGLGLLSMSRLTTGLENIFVKLSRDSAGASGKEAAQ